MHHKIEQHSNIYRVILSQTVNKSNEIGHVCGSLTGQISLGSLRVNSCIYIPLDDNTGPVNIFSGGPNLYRKTNDKTQVTIVWKSV